MICFWSACIRLSRHMLKKIVVEASWEFWCYNAVVEACVAVVHRNFQLSRRLYVFIFLWKKTMCGLIKSLFQTKRSEGWRR